MTLPLLYYGNPILRKRSNPIKDINQDIRILVKEMEKTLFLHNGIGLAAPQVGSLLRVFICIVEGDDSDGNPICGKPKVYINPILSSPDSVTDMRLEGCLSIPGIYEKVKRPIRIFVEAFDVDGSRFQEETVGWKARCIMHENDHINGILFIDRVDKKRKKAIAKELQEIKRSYNSLKSD